MESEKNNIIVKMVARGARGPEVIWGENQFPGQSRKWGRCTFNPDPFLREYDWLVVKDELPHILKGHKEVLACPRFNTLLFTCEPPCITRYGRAFTKQFGHVLTSQDERALPHPNAIRSHTGNIWYYGKTYDEVIKDKPFNKTKLISTVCSNKQMAYTVHAQRYDFTQALKQVVPEMDIFGHGVRYIPKKADALDSYKFHLTIENYIGQHHWTEKLADAFLAYTVPIYYGCPNVFDYFPEESLVLIDPNNKTESIERIKGIINKKGEYEKRLEAVIEARRRIVEEYNLPAMLSHIIESSPPKDRSPEKEYCIYSRRKIRSRNPLEFARFASWRASNFFVSTKKRIKGKLNK